MSRSSYVAVSSSGQDEGSVGDSEAGRPDGPSPSVMPATGSFIVQSTGARAALLAALVLAAVLLATSGLGEDLVEAVQSMAGSEAGFQGAAAFILVYVLATVLLFPASVLTLAAGALYGPLYGTALVSAASTLGATAAFVASRYVARPFVERQLEQNPKLQAVVRGISAQGAKIVLLLRLSPLFPFNLLNYALGVTSVGVLEYVAASWAGMLPGTFAYVFLGSTGRAAADAATGGGIEPIKLVLYGVGAVATLAVTKVASSAATRALEEAQAQESEQQQQQQP